MARKNALSLGNPISRLFNWYCAGSAGILFFLGVAAHPAGAATPARVLMFGDSITAGYGLPQADSLPAQLERALRAKGHDVTIINAGVSGNTTADGVARLDWSLDGHVDAVILELGANDMLRGLPPAQTRANLDHMLSALHQHNLPVLILGMRAAPNLGPEYVAAFDPIFPEEAAKHQALLYPFLFQDVAADHSLNQPDGLHPNPAGVAVIVKDMLPDVETLLGSLP